MNATAEIDKSGRLVVPKKLRDALHLVPGTRVTLEQKGDLLLVVKEPKAFRLSTANGIPVILGGGPLPPGHENWVQEDREDRADELSRG